MAYGYLNMPGSSLQGTESSQMWTWPGQALPNANQEPQGGKIWPQPPANSGRMQASEPGVPTEQVYPFGQPASSRQYHPMKNAGLSVATETPTEPYENQIWSATPTRTPSTMHTSQMFPSTISASSEKQSFKEEDLPQPDDTSTFRRPHLSRGGTLPMNVGQEGRKQDMENDSRYLKPHRKADSLI